MRSSRKFALLAVLALPIVAGGFLIQTRVAREGTLLLEQVLDLVSRRFVDSLPPGAMYEKAARGLVRELNDPYTELLAPKELKQFNTRTGGRYGGLGMSIEQRDGSIVVAKVFPHTPAERNGIREGDRIIKVDTMSARGWTTQQAQDALTGTPGTTVRATFSRPGVAQPLDFEFTRAIVHVPAVPYSLTFGTVGYVPLQTFNENATTDLDAAIRDLQARGARGVILDLRRNPGGILQQSLDISGLFLKPGVEIASVRGRNGENESYAVRGQPALPNVPMIVLTDEGSASASEIVAGALQDHDRAVVVGQTSFGKGLVQSVYPLDGGYALKLTTAKWYTPSGRSIQRERKFVDGRFVEEGTPGGEGRPDSLETEASKKTRPAFKSDAGRVVYGGGGITPDVIVPDDTISSGDQQLARLLAPRQEFYTLLLDYALELSKTVAPDFKPLPEWRQEVRARSEAKKLHVDAKQWDAGSVWLDRQLEHWVARYAHGDSAAARREVSIDAPLRKAIDMMNKSQNQKELFNVAQAAVKSTNGAQTPKSQNAVVPRP
jgi:carboxyl-terminal processing protease